MKMSSDLDKLPLPAAVTDHSSIIDHTTNTLLPMLVASNLEIKPRYMRVQKHSDQGAQMSITIPAEFARILSIDRADTVKVTLEGNRIVIQSAEGAAN
jgi:hypothetical protein